jgi:small subunit ribosomal protein S20
MANTKSAKKAFRSSLAKKGVNTIRKSKIKTSAKKVVDAIKTQDEKKAQTALKYFESQVMKGVTKKVIKLNTASRKLSRLASKVLSISKK